MKYDIKQFTPISGKVLIKPFKHRTRMVETIELDHEKNKDKDPLKDEMQTKKVKSRAPYEMQLGEVVASGDHNYPKGTVIVYSVKFVKEFDLFKDALLLNSFDIMGLYKMED